MASYQPGDLVHVASFGKGVIREVLNNGRYRVEVKGRAMAVAAAQLTAVDARGETKARRGQSSSQPPSDGPSRRGGSSAFAQSASADRRSLGGGWSDAPAGHDAGRVVTLDLHGHTVEEALALLDQTLNDALLAGASELHVIHGRSGGKLKTAVHRRLREMPSVRAFRIYPVNPGLTIVVL